MNSNLIKMRKALKDLLSRENEDAFVIFSDKQTGRFVQFAGSSHENLLLDLPIQSLLKQELKQILYILKQYGDFEEGVETQFSLNIDFDKNHITAAKVALDIMCQVFELSKDFELEADIDGRKLVSMNEAETMDRESLSLLGLKLSSQLLRLSENYNVRSDSYDILGYESAIVEEWARDLVVDKYKTLSPSVLLGGRGNILSKKQPKITKKVSDFYQQCEGIKNETQR